LPKRVCIIGTGAIGSLYAAHLARVADVYAFVRRADHAAALNQSGLRVSGKHDFTARLSATANAAEIPECNLAIVACKATQTEEAIAPFKNHFAKGAILSAQNGLGCEELIAERMRGFVIRGTTFMSGTRHADTHVQYELDTATWMGPFEPSGTPFSIVQEAAALIVESGLKAVALEDAKPAQWSKIVFNSSVNAVAALTELPHCREFAEENNFGDLGHLLHALIEEGKQVAAGLGIRLYEDPWEMNKIGAQTDHPPSMLYDVKHHLKTEADFLCGAIAQEAERHGLQAPLHSAVYRLIKAKELSWTWKPAARNELAGKVSH
jgi:2-dehydropantoate 2-reductase